MNEPIEESYFDWLCAKVLLDSTPNYLELFRILHSHIFESLVSGDHNRVADAIELREDFLDEHQIVVEMDWFNQPTSIFEVLIAFSDRAAYQIDMAPQEWFWQFIANLKLDDYRRASVSDRQTIHRKLDRFVTRNYEPNGDGGLFPLRRPQRDQREVEIWYQFCDYVEDTGLLYGLV